MNSIATLIDADTMVFFLAYNHREKDDVEAVLAETDTFVELVLTRTNCTHYLGFLGGENNFRNEVATHLVYKGNRGEKPDWFRKWEPYIRMRLIDKWKFTVCDNIEAEDGVSICNKYYKESTNIVIAHIDKDLDDIEGNHYNYKSHTFYYVDYLGKLELNAKRKVKGSGKKWFWCQMIIGDKNTDNIEGLKGKGDVFAYNLLYNCKTEYSMFRKVYTAYLTVYSKLGRREYGRKLFIETLKLIGMLEEPAYGFTIPELIPREYKLSNDELKDLFGS